MMAGDSGTIVVSTSTDFFSRQIKAGIYRPLDKALLTNWNNLDPHILQLESQADWATATPCPICGTSTAYARNVDMIGRACRMRRSDSLGMVFKPEVIRHFADCGVTFFDGAEGVLQLALNYLHLDPNTQRRRIMPRRKSCFLRLRPYIRAFDSSEYMNRLATGRLLHLDVMVGGLRHLARRARAAGVDVPWLHHPRKARTLPSTHC